MSLEYLRRNKRLKKALVSTVVFCCCLVGCKFSAHAAVDVREIYSNNQSTKYKVTLSDNIYKITDINGLQIVPEQISGKSVLFSNGGNKKVKIYVNRDEYVEVDLQNAVKDKKEPSILWKYKNTDKNMICLKAEDDAGVYQANSVGNVESARVILTNMPKSAEISLEMKESDDSVRIYDVFGNYQPIRMENITLDIEKAIRNANGDSVLLKLRDSKDSIRDITHIDGEVIALVPGKGVDSTYDTISGTMKIKINYDNLKEIVLSLDTDTKMPEIIRAYKSGSGRKVFVEAEDVQSGIRKFSVYNSNEEMEDVIEQITGVNEVRLISKDIPDGSTHVCVYDGVHNKAELDLADMVVDDKSPLVTIDYDDGLYILNVVKDKSGIESVSLDGEDVDVYNNNPVGEFSYRYENLDGESVIKACDGIGNVALVTVNETMCTVRRAYRNAVGSRLSIDVEDKRGIQRITDQYDNPIERFLYDTNQAKGYYKVRPNTSQVKIFYLDGKSYALNLEELTNAVGVADEVYEDGLVSRCKVSSKAGIKKVQYKDGRKISFKQDLPDDITIECTVTDEHGVAVPTFVTVYDAVGNSININESLG